jgi:hypothetical protein
MSRSSKRFAVVAFVAVVALVVAAVSALAAPTESKVQWYTGASPGSVELLSGGTVKAASATIGENPTTGKKFKWTWEYLGHKYAMSATGVSCLECVIRNQAALTGVAQWTGELVFTGTKMEEPAGCSLSEEKLTTTPLLIQADYMEPGELKTEKWIAKIAPTNGETTILFTLGTGCPHPGAARFKGTTYGEFKKSTGEFLLTQEMNLSPAISTKAGSSWQFIESAPVSMTGTLAFSVGGSYFGVK